MLEARAIHKSYDSIQAVRDVSIHIGRGETVVIQGASGSGKTTFLRLLAGLEKPDRGTVWQDGQVVVSADECVPPHRRALGFVFQESALWPHLSAADNIGFGLESLPRGEAQIRVHHLAHLLGIEELLTRHPHELSGGQARRVAIARTLAPRPTLLLLDEPLVHLDRDLSEQVMMLIRQESQGLNAALVVVTHDHDEADRWGGQRFRMIQGCLEAVKSYG